MSAVPVERVDDLQAYAAAVASCTRCRLAQGRTQVVFGAGNPHAELMFVGEAPGFHEDKQGLPFVGQAGKLLEKLLAGIGLHAQRRLHRERPEVPPSGQPRSAAGRDRGVREPPLPADRADRADDRRDARQLRDEAPLGPSARHHARARAGAADDPRRPLGALYPLYHPAAALYTPAMLKVLESDFARIPELLGRALVPARSPSSPSSPSLAPPAEQLGPVLTLRQTPHPGPRANAKR